MKIKIASSLIFILFSFGYLSGQTDDEISILPRVHISFYVAGNLWNQPAQRIKSSLDLHQFDVTTQKLFFGRGQIKHPRSESRLGLIFDIDLRLKSRVYYGGMVGISSLIETRGVHTNNGHLYINHDNFFFSPIIRLYDLNGKSNVFTGFTVNYFNVVQQDAWQSTDTKLYEEKFIKPGFLIGGQLMIVSKRTWHLGIQTQLQIAGKVALGPFYNRSDEIMIREISTSTSHVTLGLTGGVRLY